MNHEIRLYGPIGGWGGYTAQEIVDQIPGDAKEITMRIHSPGGSVGEGLAIYHALRDHKAKVTTIVDGYAASSASFVMLAGDERHVHRNSIVFVHNPWTYAEGNAEELRKTADGLDVHAAAILDIYKQRTGMEEQDLRDMMEETAFFRGVDAKENGFATAVLDDPEAEAQIAAMMKFESIAAQAKEQKEMSTQKTRKEIEAAAAVQAKELETAQAEIGAIKEAQAKEIEAIRAEHEAEMLAKDDALAQAQVTIDTSAQTIIEINARVDELTAANAALNEEIATVRTQAETQGAELAKAQAALKNPAVADAVMGEAKTAAQMAIDAEADKAEEEAKAKAEAEAPKNIREEYEAMAPGQDRVNFWNKNKRAIIACEVTTKEEK